MKVVRLFHPSGPDRVAVVSAEPAFQPPGRYLVRLRRGPRATSLSGGGVFGPFSEEDAAARIEQLAQQLRDEGFLESGIADLLAGLDDSDSAVRARAALKLGWRRHEEAAPQLVAMLSTAVDEMCSVIDALGAMGDPQAVEPIRQLAKRKLLSRRRSAVEALRVLEDSIGLAEAHQRAVGELPPALAAAVEASHHDPQPLLQALDEVPSKRLGLYLDTLYEIATPACVAAVRARLATMSFAQPFVWRYVKSILKRSQLRHDFQTFGWLAHRIELQSFHAKRVRAKVKSGYDGVSRDTTIFSRRTRKFVRRQAWRYLRQLAKYRPELYPHAAAEAIAAYLPSDAVQPRGLQGQFGHCYVLHRVLLGGSKRYLLNEHRLAFYYLSSQSIAVPPGVREEAYPELWDQQPAAYLRILARGSLATTIDFAMQAIAQRHPQLLQEAPAELLAPILSSPHAQAAEMAAAELARRFRPERPDLELLDVVLADLSDPAQDLGRRWLAGAAPHWARDPERALRYVRSPIGATMAVAADALCQALNSDPAARQALVPLVCAALRDPVEPMEGVAQVARRALLAELMEQVSIEEALQWIDSPLPAVQAVGANLLGGREGAEQRLGIAKVAQLAEHEVAVVRSEAHHMLRRLQQSGQGDLDALFQLVDSRWQDTRAVALELLRESRDWSHADPDQIAGLIDSLRTDVQDFAIELIRGHADTLDTVELLRRIAEHPHANVRRFALELAEQRLPAGPEALASLLPCLRRALLDPWPQRESKQRALRILLQRSADRQQAEASLQLLGEWVGVAGREDFEDALQTIARIQLLHDDLRSPVTLRLEAGR